MNEQNFEYLKDNIKYMGFGENMHEALSASLKEGKPEFTLNGKFEINKKPFEVDLHFRKSDNSDMYFFNSYDATLRRTNGEKMEQTFFLTKGKGVTAKEAYNLLEGRAVFKNLTNKDGQEYKAWLQLDFDKSDKNNNYEVRQFHENYGFDLKAAVSRLPVQELKSPDSEKSLLNSLQKGNLQSVTIEKDGSSSKMFIEANPQYKTVNLFDGNMKRMQKEDLQQYKSIAQPVAQTITKEEIRDTKKNVTEKVQQKPGVVPDNSKKKTSRSKGMKT